MEESKELQGFYKIFRAVIYVSILEKNRISSVTHPSSFVQTAFCPACQTVNNQYTKKPRLCHENPALWISFTFQTKADGPHALFANSHLWYNKR